MPQEHLGRSAGSTPDLEECLSCLWALFLRHTVKHELGHEGMPGLTLGYTQTKTRPKANRRWMGLGPRDGHLHGTQWALLTCEIYFFFL